MKQAARKHTWQPSSRRGGSDADLGGSGADPGRSVEAGGTENMKTGGSDLPDPLYNPVLLG